MIFTSDYVEKRNNFINFCLPFFNSIGKFDPCGFVIFMSVAAPLMYVQGWLLVHVCTGPALCTTRVKRVTLVYVYHVNRWDNHKKLSIAKFDFVQVCGLSLNFYNNTLCKFYKFSDSWQTWTSLTLQSVDWPISRQYHRPQMRKRASYPKV